MTKKILSFFLIFILLFISSCEVVNPNKINKEYIFVTVKKVVDGDTFIDYEGEKYRILGIDSPEIGEFKKKDIKILLEYVIILPTKQKCF
ncbi:thermonuclease family protein [Mycoplasma elephantis]|uniref:thermonuclease family protein n=1 Tax=Mycoplasma elephantis TaxID=114882 RepID=UPI0004868F4D|nr:hypothetical protein [Mycoplasma elephantis]